MPPPSRYTALGRLLLTPQYRRGVRSLSSKYSNAFLTPSLQSPRSPIPLLHLSHRNPRIARVSWQWSRHAFFGTAPQISHRLHHRCSSSSYSSRVILYLIQRFLRFVRSVLKGINPAAVVQLEPVAAVLLPAEVHQARRPQVLPAPAEGRAGRAAHQGGRAGVEVAEEGEGMARRRDRGCRPSLSLGC